MTDGKTANETFDSIRQHVTTGTLTTGEALPPVRELAIRLNVNRNTVVVAYKRPVTSGLVWGLGRDDTVIKEITAPVTLEGGNPNTPLISLSDGSPVSLCLPDLNSYFTEIDRDPRSYGNVAVSSGLEAWMSQ